MSQLHDRPSDVDFFGGKVKISIIIWDSIQTESAPDHDNSTREMQHNLLLTVAACIVACLSVNMSP